MAELGRDSDGFAIVGIAASAGRRGRAITHRLAMRPLSSVSGPGTGVVIVMDQVPAPAEPG